MPELWLLASSEGSASVAAHCGLPLSWAHFINGNGAETCNLYRKHFRPSFEHSEPVISVGVNVLCADSEKEAASMLEGIELWRKDGLRGPIPKSVNQESQGSLTVLSPSRPMVVGTPEMVHEQLLSVANDYQAEELLIVTICHDHGQRKNSYQLIAEQFNQ
jgi:alkanesulfonate monooxygenase SsuD/methylene tetrahydromethanopterin reductase-like flavin-dependent oxidoreductase (luciferase family)